MPVNIPVSDHPERPGGDNIFAINENQGVHYQSIDERIVNAGKSVYIYSVDPNMHIVAKGGRGDFLIPGKPEGERVSDPLVIPANYPEHMHMGTSMSPVHYTPGMDLARDIVGVDSADKGLGRHTSNLEWHGIFISYNEKPKKEEIERAEARRKQFLERVVADADRKAMSGKLTDIDAFERAAAHELHLKKTWAEKPTALESCPACGSGVNAGIAVCPNCKAILDETKARQFFPERFTTEPKA